MEMAVRDMVYVIKQDSSQPQFWLDMGNPGTEPIHSFVRPQSLPARSSMPLPVSLLPMATGPILGSMAAVAMVGMKSGPVLGVHLAGAMTGPVPAVVLISSGSLVVRMLGRVTGLVSMMVGAVGTTSGLASATLVDSVVTWVR